MYYEWCESCGEVNLVSNMSAFCCLVWKEALE